MHFIFDLDHTVIDSSHRQLTNADGSLDLAHWRENCTHEKIMADTLLPLARTMREALEHGSRLGSVGYHFSSEAWSAGKRYSFQTRRRYHARRGIENAAFKTALPKGWHHLGAVH
jgi:hypothetical protein